MQDKALQSEKMQDNPAKSRTVGNSVASYSCCCNLYTLKVLYHRQCQYTQANEYHFDGANSIETTYH